MAKFVVLSEDKRREIENHFTPPPLRELHEIKMWLTQNFSEFDYRTAIPEQALTRIKRAIWCAAESGNIVEFSCLVEFLDQTFVTLPGWLDQMIEKATNEILPRQS